MQYKGGVLLASDTLASYGSLARFKDVQRLKSVGTHTVLGAGGEMSDFQVRRRISVSTGRASSVERRPLHQILP